MNLKKGSAGTFIGLIVAVVISYFYISGTFTKLQYIASDFLRTTFTKNVKESDIVYLLITDATIAEADEIDGIQWPWPRQAYGEAIKFLNKAGSTHIAFDMIFSETSIYGPEDDETFAEIIQKGNVTLSYLSTNRKGNVSPDKINSNDELMLSQALPVKMNNFKGKIKEVKYFRPAVDVLMNASDKVGDVKFIADSDGVGRRVSMMFKHHGNYYPSLSLAVAMQVLEINKIILTGNKIVLTGDNVRREIPLDKEGMTWLKYYGDSSVYDKFLLLRVIKSQAKIEEGEEPHYDRKLFKDKIAIIASDATDLKDLRPNPFNKINDPGGHYQGTAIDNILKGEFVIEFYDPIFVIPLLFFFSMITSLSATRLNAYLGFLFVVMLLLFKAAVSAYMFRYHNILTEISASIIAIVTSFSLASIMNYIIESQQRAFIVGAFGQYLSPKLVARLVKNPSKLKLGGEEKIMTAFFSDIAGFSGISEKLNPENLVSLLNEYLSEMCDIIGKHNGTVDKFEGDAIIAFWGAPIELEEHAVLACRASVEMQIRMVRFRKDLRKQGRHELFVRMGLNSGAMVVGNMGSKTRMDYTIIGDSVNLASRLEGANKFYDTNIIISEYTHELVKEEFETRELDQIRVVGRNKPVRIYELMALNGCLSEEEKKGIELFQKAICLYREQKFQDAIDVFDQVLDYMPEDSPTKKNIKRCYDFIENKPGENWDGVCNLTSKG